MARLTVELLRPVPLAPLQAVARTIRPGRKVQWLEGMSARRWCRGRRATALRLRPEEVDVADAVSPPVPAPPPVSAGAPPAMQFFDREHIGYWSANNIPLVRGGFGVVGPASAWLRLKCPVVGVEQVAPFERVAAAADFGSGIGNPLTFVRVLVINPEVSIHTFRHPEGEWVGMESGGWAAVNGVGLAETTLHDERGLLGRAAETLLVSPIGGGRSGFAAEDSPPQP